MIRIKEKVPNKLPGLTSLTIESEYNPAVIEAIKSCGNSIYDKKTKLWEVPTTALSQLINNVYMLDDIELELYNKKDKKSKEKKCDPKKFKTKPFDYQIEGINFGLNNDKWLLLDTMGLGKTISSIYVAQSRKELGEIDHCLVICGVNALKSNWKNEVKKHSKLSCRILGERQKKNGEMKIGSIQERIADLKKPIKEFFVITNIETIRNDDIVKLINKGPNKFDMIIVDEIHTCFSYDTLIDTDRGKLKIGDIVTNKIDCLVKSRNKSGDIEYKPILNYYEFASKMPLIRLEIVDEENIEHIIKCTPDHEILTSNRGYVRADEIDENDDVIIG